MRSDTPRKADVQLLLSRVRDLLSGGDEHAALAELRSAYDRDPTDAQIRSYYGLCLGLAERKYNEGSDLCQSAVKQEFFNPELYLNVARLNLSFGFKAESLRYLRRAKMIDPASAACAELLAKLGYRSQPVVPFLPRRHLLNRWLGSARSAFLCRASRWRRRPRPE